MSRAYRLAEPAAASTAAAPLRFTFDGKRYRRLRRRHARLGAARQRRAPGRPLVQVSPAARHPHRRLPRSRTRWSASARRRRATTPNTARHRRSSSTTGSSPRARTAGRRSRFDVGAVNDLLVAALPGRLLLQDLHVAAPLLGRASTSRAIRAPPASAARRPRPIPTATPAATRIATCWSSAPARPASPRRWRRPQPARASSSCDEQAGARRLAARTTRRATIDGKPARDWLARSARDAAAMPRTSRCCRAPPPSATTTTTSSASPSASPTISADPPPALPRERLWQVRAQAGRARRPARIERPLVFPDNDRPGHHAGRTRRAPTSTATACAPGTRAVDRHRPRQRLSRPRSTSRTRGVEVAAIVDVRADADGGR